MKKAVLVLAVVMFCGSALSMEETDDLKTEFPVVFIHGLFGFGDHVAWLVSYWGQIPKALRKQGVVVYVAELSQAHHIETCGEQLSRQLKAWKHARYNLIGHSFGGLTARFVREKHPELVESITTIGTPHKGSKVADLIYRTINALPLLSRCIWTAGNLACHAIAILSGNLHRQDLKKAMYCLTSSGIDDFNKAFPKGLGDDDATEQIFSCGSYDMKTAGVFDFCSISLRFVGLLFYGFSENDGLVDKNSMTCGKWVGAFLGAHHVMPTEGSLGRYKKEMIVEFEKFLIAHLKHLKKMGH